MASTSEITSASNIQMDYMKLLITQLQNQNPLEPLNNNEMATQLAQFSQLQQLESMNESFADVLGVVEQVYNNIDGEILLGIGNHTVSLEDVISVNN